MDTKTSDNLQATTEPTAVFINVPIPVDLHRRLRIRQVTDGLVMREAIVAALEEWLR